MRRLLSALIFTCLAVLSAAQTKPSTLKSLYVEDQRDRGVALADDAVTMLAKAQADKLPSYDWEKEVPKRDEARRQEARLLLARPGLTGEDFYFASYLFQHGQEANDYLFAHILATEAMALGYTRARWISAATLDRYLQRTGQKQVFGTQFQGENLAYYLEHQHDPDVVAKFKALSDQQTLQPYAPQLVPDSIRADFCVPALALQERHIADVKEGKARSGDLPRVPGCEH